MRNCQPAVTAWDLHLAKLVHRDLEPSIDDPTVLCRDDRCPREAPHLAHPILDADDDMTIYDTSGLNEVTLRHVGTREVRTAGQIYTDVCDDYGYLNFRTVQDCLYTLATRREVVLVLPANTRRRLTDPSVLSRSGGAASIGAWIRYTSPLLFDPDGYSILASQVEDLISDRHRTKRPSRPFKTIPGKSKCVAIIPSVTEEDLAFVPAPEASACL